MLTPPQRSGQKHFRLIACEIYYREICRAVALSRHVVDLVFISKGLHDVGADSMRARLQEVIGQTAADKYDAILLAYGRCNNGTVGLCTGDIPVVIPRVHDCIGALMGSAARHKAWFDEHPGTFYRSSGWIERDFAPNDSIMSQLGLDLTKDELIAKYGPENADYIMQELGNWTENYTDLAYVDMGLEIDREYAGLTKQEAIERGLNFQQIKGDNSLLQNLVNGIWPEKDFLTAPPHSRIIAQDDGLILDFENKFA